MKALVYFDARTELKGCGSFCAERPSCSVTVFPHGTFLYGTFLRVLLYDISRLLVCIYLIAGA